MVLKIVVAILAFSVFAVSPALAVSNHNSPPKAISPAEKRLLELLDKAKSGDDAAIVELAPLVTLMRFTKAINDDELMREQVYFKPYKIPTEAMNPTIAQGDYILANLRCYKTAKPRRGDVVVFEYPEDRSKDFIKRVVAIGGDEIAGRDKEIFVNKERVIEPYIVHLESELISAGVNPRDTFGPIVVPKDSVFVMGDNRDRSYDSRFFGPVPLHLVKGKAFFTYWSPDPNRIGQEIKDRQRLQPLAPGKQPGHNPGGDL